jgi:uncharacterized protein DUF6573
MEQVTQEGSMTDKKKKEVDPIFGEVIYAYTRAQALADGVLVDVTQMAKEAGLVHPTVITQALWHDLNTIPQGFSYESFDGRLWDVLWMSRLAAGKPDNQSKSRITYEVIRHTRNKPFEQLIELVMDCGPGDNAEPVLTIGYQEDF